MERIGLRRVDESGREKMLRALARMSTDPQDVHAHPKAVTEGTRPGAGYGELVANMEELRALAAGVGPAISSILADPRVTDVLINSSHVWIDRGNGVESVDVDLGDTDDIRALAVRMAAACGKRLDDAAPIVDGTLPMGVRLHAVLPPLSASGPLVSLRTASRTPLSLADLVHAGTVNPRLGLLLASLVLGRANLLISGATGAGKTTLLSALLALVPADQRVICIEEVAELGPDHPHVVTLQERRPNVQGIGAVPLPELVRAAMRMRPDRLVLGECRGAEVRDVLTALNTGHEGGMATVHANTVEAVPARLLALGALAGMGEEALGAQAVAALDAVIQIRRSTSAGAPPLPVFSSRYQRYQRDTPSPLVASSCRRWVSQVGVLKREGTGLVCVPALEVGADGYMRQGEGFFLLEQRLGHLVGNLLEGGPWDLSGQGST